MNKEIDLDVVAAQLALVSLAIEYELGRVWDNLPEKEGGFPSVRSDFVGLGMKLWNEQLMPAIKDYTNGEIDPWNLPEPEPEPEEPEGSNEIIIQNTGKKMSWNGEPYDKFVFKDLGPNYTTEPFDLVFEDGNKLFVKDPEKMTMTPDNMKYQPGGKYSGNNPDIPTMEVYARKGTHPKWVKAVFRHPVDAESVAPEPEPATGDGWIRLYWGGDADLDWHSDDNRSRLWWTEIHGQSGDKRDWSRKFPLPKSVEYERGLDFRFSDGATLSVSNPNKMAMHSNGPKYRPQDGNNEHNKNHPKVAAIPGSPVTWVEYKVR